MLNPEQKFVVSVVRRKDIAEFIQPYAITGSVDPTDDRLTDEFCDEYANGMYLIETDTLGMSEDTQDDALTAWAMEMAEKFNGYKI